MIEYKKLQWVDEVKDQNENLIREGTPLSAKNHNRMEDGITAAVMGVNNNSSIIKDSLPSGFLKLGEYNKSYTENHLNIIRLTTKSIALINGNRLEIPEGTNITLPNPPLTGEREDLVFLEAWFDQTTRDLKWRIRVVAGVDFKTYPEGIGIEETTWNRISWSEYKNLVKPQGGNDAPIDFLSNKNVTYAFIKVMGMINGASTSKERNYNFIDPGVYVSGSNDTDSKSILKTYDGLVYAIPMFRVWRRNSSPFSDINPNGGNLFKSIGVQNKTGKKIFMGDEFELTLQDGYTTTGITSGMILCDSSKVKYNEVLAVISDTKLKCRMLFPSGMDINGQWAQWVKQRPDQLNSDQIDVTDIIDLRHKTSLTGFNYDQLLQENFELALRGELQTNTYNDLLKTYHGIRKTPIDANTIFYCSFDGTTIPEVGANLADLSVFALNQTSMPGFVNTPTGLGVKMIPVNPNVGVFAFPNLKATMDSILTVDVGVMISDKGSVLQPPLLNIGFGSYYTRFGWGSGGNYVDNPNFKVGYNHLRVVLKNRVLYLYVNGKLQTSTDSYFDHHENPTSGGGADMFRIHILSDNNNSYNLRSTWSLFDMSISNIDRGDTFATLPKDFIEGHAKIMPAFNEQRWSQSDALSVEFKQDVIKSASPSTYPRYLKVNQSSGNWASGDKITIKGLGGDVISGVIDSDTALARVIANSKVDGTLYLDDASKININDTVQLLQNGKFYENVTVTAVDKTNNTITVTSQWTTLVGDLIFETTPNSSVPIVKALNPTTNQLEQKAGTWTNLGTNEATFTFGTNSNLTNQDIIVEYSLIEAPGQGAFSDVLFQTLGGEVNGKKLIRSEGTHIIDDFSGKVKGSLIENPNVIKYVVHTVFFPPTDNRMVEETADLSKIYQLDNKLIATGNSGLNNIAQEIFSWNVVEIIERKYGKINSVDKIKWVKDNVSSITCNWWGYGTNSKGNSAYLTEWVPNSNKWASEITLDYISGERNHKLPTVSKLRNYQSIGGAYITNDGFIHFMAFTDSSDGVTSSMIFTDYVSIEITLKKPSDEYDIICPINPRRDDGLGTIAFIRKETNELRFPFKAPTNAITYGNYVKYQGAGILPKSGLYCLTDWKVIATSIGTGGYDPKGNAWSKFYKGLYSLPMITKDDAVKYQGFPMKILGKETSITKVEYHNVNYGLYPMVLFNSVGEVGLGNPYYRGYWMDNFIGRSDIYDGVYGIHPNVEIEGSYYIVAARLVKDPNGNIMMIIAKSLSDTLKNDGGASVADTFYLNARPIEAI